MGGRLERCRKPHKSCEIIKMGCMSSKQAKEGAVPPPKLTTTKKEATNTEARSDSFRVIKTNSPSVPTTAQSTTSPTTKGDDEWWSDATTKSPTSTPTYTTPYQPSHTTAKTSSSSTTGYHPTRGPIYRSYGPSYAYTSLYDPLPIVNVPNIDVIPDNDANCSYST